MKIRKGDTVLIISGKDRSKKGKVMKSLPKEREIIVEGINLRKTHLKPKKTGEKGQIVEKSAPFDVSNVKLICSKCGQATRVGYKLGGDKLGGDKISGRSKYRVCKKCGQEI